MIIHHFKTMETETTPKEGKRRRRSRKQTQEASRLRCFPRTIPYSKCGGGGNLVANSAIFVQVTAALGFKIRKQASASLLPLLLSK